MFAQCERRVCANLTVENDGTLEEMESFEVTLERTPGLDHRIILAPVTAEINIIDDDGMPSCMLIQTLYIVCAL